MRSLLPLVALLAIGCDSSSDVAVGSKAAAPASGGGWTILDAPGNRPTFHDFGRVPYGKKVEHVFRIRNDEPGPVTVIDIQPACSCAVARISYRKEDGTIVEGSPTSREKVITVPPGSTAELLVRIDTEHVEAMNLDKLAQVRLRSDSRTTPYLTFELHLVVERVMRAVPAAIELGQTPQSAGKSGRTDVTRDEAQSRARVTGVESVEGPFTATVDETEIGGVPVWIVVASAEAGLPIGPVAGKVVLSVSGDDGTGAGAPFTVPVTAQIAADVVLRPPVMLFGAIERGKGAAVEAELVTLVPGERVKVMGTKVSTVPEGATAGIDAKATPVDPDEAGRASSWKVSLRASPQLAEPAFSGVLTIELDHPRVREIRAPISGATK